MVVVVIVVIMLLVVMSMSATVVVVVVVVHLGRGVAGLEDLSHLLHASSSRASSSSLSTSTLRHDSTSTCTSSSSSREVRQGMGGRGGARSLGCTPMEEEEGVEGARWGATNMSPTWKPLPVPGGKIL